MRIYQLIFLISFGICFLSCLYHFFRTLFLTRPREYAKARGKVLPAVVYSFTGAMSPAHKETAYLHLPTYVSGLVYHLGTFLSLILVFLFVFGFYPFKVWSVLFSAFLAVSFLAGLFILVKRIVKRGLRLLSNPDDYISNVLVTLLHGFVFVTLVWHPFVPVLLVWTSLLMFYIPLGKLKHMVYFFTSRIYLARFYGKRGVWPLENTEG